MMREWLRAWGWHQAEQHDQKSQHRLMWRDRAEQRLIGATRQYVWGTL